MNIDDIIENARLKGRVIALEAEVERLQSEVDEARRCSGAGMKVMLGLSDDLVAENARLKAEVEAYRSASDEVAAAFLALPAPHNQVARVCEGIERLKAEVERLTKQKLIYLYREKVLDDMKRLQAEVERLRKAGDSMYEVIYGFNWLAFNKDITNTLQAWNAAKDGKPSA